MRDMQVILRDEFSKQTHQSNCIIIPEISHRKSVIRWSPIPSVYPQLPWLPGLTDKRATNSRDQDSFCPWLARDVRAKTTRCEHVFFSFLFNVKMKLDSNHEWRSCNLSQTNSFLFSEKVHDDFVEMIFQTQWGKLEPRLLENPENTSF